MKTLNGFGPSRKALAAFTILAVGLGAMALRGSKPASAAVGETTTSSYHFESITVGEGEETNAARVSYAVSWAADEYPGERLCHWEVQAEDGSVLGEADMQIASASAKTSSTLGVDVPITEGESPYGARVTCGDRLDDPSTVFSISNVRVERPEAYGPQGFLVRFDYSFEAANDVPAAQACHVSLINEEAEVLHAQNGALMVAAGRGTSGVGEFRATVGDAVSPSRVSSAEVDCGRLQS